MKISILIKALGILALAYLAFVGILIISPAIGSYFNRVKFDSSRWKNWKESEADMSLRWNMVHDLKRRYALIGMSSLEIKELLGEPSTETDHKMTYSLGMSGHGIDTGELVFHLKGGKVIDYDVWHG